MDDRRPHICRRKAGWSAMLHEPPFAARMRALRWDALNLAGGQRLPRHQGAWLGISEQILAP
jgi:hypothetical protein